ncbi:multiheme c-type cytochrome [Pirellulales bacterium]|nr:multiheme c-type cytochrome [Pirellulales bacterium]
MNHWTANSRALGQPIYTSLVSVFVAAVACVHLNTTVLAQDGAPLPVGSQACSKCHESEFKACQASPHAAAAYKNLSHDKAPEFARAMGVTGSLDQSMCADCHSTDPPGAAIKGVSCEACHNPAGPKDRGWFWPHCSQEIKFTGDGHLPIELRKLETEQQRAQRLAEVDKLGMNRTEDVYDIAKNCLSCHTVPNERLVNSGHPTSKRFELVRWSQGSIRHNFGLDQATNAECPTLWLNAIPARPNRSPENRKKLMFVAGQLADLEVSLRARARASDGEFGKAFNARIDDAIDELEDVNHIPEVQQAIGAVSNVDRRRLRDFGPGDAQFFEKAADGIAVAAAKFVKNHQDGDHLGEVKTPRRTEGDPFEP